MLVLSRKQHQQIVIDNRIRITILKIRGNTVRIGIEAPLDVPVRRGELSEQPANETVVEFRNRTRSRGNPELRIAELEYSEAAAAGPVDSTEPASRDVPSLAIDHPNYRASVADSDS